MDQTCSPHPPNSYTEMLTFDVMALGGEVYRGIFPRMDPLRKETQEIPLSFPPCEDTARSRPSPDTNLLTSPSWTSQPPKL